MSLTVTSITIISQCVAIITGALKTTVCVLTGVITFSAAVQALVHICPRRVNQVHKVR